MACYQTQLLSQCTPGPFSFDPDSPAILGCTGNTVTFSDPCAMLPQPGPQSSATMTVPSGMQVCFQAPNTGSFTFQTCNLTGDDTFITIFDTAGNPIAWNDDSCGLQSSTFIFVNAGDNFCLQIESAINGVCQGTASSSPNYEVDVFCGGSVLYEQIFTEPNACNGEVVFNDFQILTLETGLEVSDQSNNFSPTTNSFSFPVGNLQNTILGGSLTLCASGDLGFISEIWNLIDETGNCLGGLGQFGLGDCFGETCTSFNFSATELETYLQDGVIVFDALNDSAINDFCPENFVSMELSICGEPVIPTMGEWGLICLCLMLLSLGVLAIREKQLVIN